MHPSIEQVEAMKALARDPQPVHLEVNKLDAFVLLGALQLVTRHPHLPDRTRKVVTRIARAIQSGVAPDGALNAIAEMGWDRANDVQTNGS